MIDEAKRYATLKYADQKEGLYKYNGFMDAIQWMENKKLSSDYIFHTSRYSIEYKGIEITLQKKVFKLALHLFLNKNRYIGKKEMFDNVWEPDVIVDDRTIDVHITKIRKLIPGVPIITKKRVGYAWIEENQDNG